MEQSAQIFIVVQILLDLLLVALILHLARKMQTRIHEKASQQAVDRVFSIIEPLLARAEETAREFDGQIKEKNKIINGLNEKLDTRIISLNLLLNRASSSSSAETDPAGGTIAASDLQAQQKKIWGLHQKGYDKTAIAEKLSLPQSEVDLVIHLKNTFFQNA